MNEALIQRMSQAHRFLSHSCILHLQGLDTYAMAKQLSALKKFKNYFLYSQSVVRLVQPIQRNVFIYLNSFITQTQTQSFKNRIGRDF